jgi:hypothetical protein
MPDLFTRPYPLAGDVVIDIGPQFDQIARMLAQHVSQVFEFLPFNQGISAQVPDGPEERLAWLKSWFGAIIRPRADRFREQLIAQYGTAHGRQVELAEAYEISEYASPLTREARSRLFWFLPNSG